MVTFKLIIIYEFVRVYIQFAQRKTSFFSWVPQEKDLLLFHCELFVFSHKFIVCWFASLRKRERIVVNLWHIFNESLMFLCMIVSFQKECGVVLDKISCSCSISLSLLFLYNSLLCYLFQIYTRRLFFCLGTLCDAIKKLYSHSMCAKSFQVSANKYFIKFEAHHLHPNCNYFLPFFFSLSSFVGIILRLIISSLACNIKNDWP